MKRIIGVIGLAVFLAVAVGAQESPVRAAIDWAVSDGPGRVVIAGWAFNCATEGQQPFSARVYYTAGGTTTVATLALRYSGLFRPDVASAFGDCGALNRYTGYQLVVTGLPVGPATVWVEWADAQGVRYVSAQVTVQ
ncbi:MAG: hypothetical protein ABI603_01750 [Acidobacteriota bacterium]